MVSEALQLHHRLLRFKEGWGVEGQQEMADEHKKGLNIYDTIIILLLLLNFKSEKLTRTVTVSSVILWCNCRKLSSRGRT